MNRIRLLRLKLYTQWVMPPLPEGSLFPAESALLRQLKTYTDHWFNPYPFTNRSSDDYHYQLAFFVQAVELIPLNLDLAFDAMWRATESLWGRSISPYVGKKVHELAPSVARSLASETYIPVLQDYLAVIPAQTCEFLIDRLLSVWPLIDKSDSKRIWDRINWRTSYPRTLLLIEAMASKYRSGTFTLDARRKAAMLLRLAMSGEAVTVGREVFDLPVDERISFLINALLYTFRNDRFHGNMQPPFKSSKGTLQTYAHAHYCFLWAHLLSLHALVETDLLPGEHGSVATNAKANLASFKSFYGNHLRR